MMGGGEEKKNFNWYIKKKGRDYVPGKAGSVNSVGGRRTRKIGTIKREAMRDKTNEKRGEKHLDGMKVLFTEGKKTGRNSK